MLPVDVRFDTRALKPMLIRLCAALPLLLFALQAVAAAPAGHQQKLQRIMELEGLNMIIKQIPKDLLNDIRQHTYLDRQRLSKEQIDTIEQVAGTNFDPKRIRREVLQRLQEHYEARRIDAVLAELRKPLYRKITALEKRANSPEEAEDLQAYVARLALHNPDPKRVRLMKELDRASHSTEIAVSVEVEIAKTLMRCAAAYNPDDRKLSPERLEKIAGRIRRKITPSVRNNIVIWSLYAYRSLSSRELRDYTALYQNEDIQWFTRVSSRALIQALDNASTHSARGVARLRDALHI